MQGRPQSKANILSRLIITVSQGAKVITHSTAIFCGGHKWPSPLRRRPESEGWFKGVELKGLNLTPPAGKSQPPPGGSLTPVLEESGLKAEGAVVVASFNNLSQALKKFIKSVLFSKSTKVERS